MAYIISLEGNIGAGKSTFLNLLRNNIKSNDLINIEFVDEPLEMWLKVKDENNINLLDNFYKNQERWSYTFQNYAYLTHKKYLDDTLKKMNKDNNEYKINIIFCERSTLTDRYVFGQQLYNDGKINKLEWDIYLEWFNWLETNTNKVFSDLSIDKHIYLRASPDICLERIKNRNRTEECNIPFEYLNNIHQRHDEWLLNPTNKNNVIVFDISDNYIHDQNRINEILNSIRSLIDNIVLGD